MSIEEKIMNSWDQDQEERIADGQSQIGQYFQVIGDEIVNIIAACYVPEEDVVYFDFHVSKTGELTNLNVYRDDRYKEALNK